MDELNSEQRKAALHINGPLLVLAGAGTGKTKVIISRIAHMISKGIAPKKIVALSFTNKAAKEMQERLVGYVGKKAANEVTLSTFHSFCLTLLRKFPAEAGLGPKFGIASESVSLNLLRESLAENKLGEMLALPVAAQKISNAKDNLLDLEGLANSKLAFDRAFLAPLFNGYQRRLRLYDLVDFDDIVYLTTLMIRSKPDILQKIQDHYSHFLIDEYQDTSSGQLEFIAHIGSGTRNVCVVGDDDQSIYSWRGAKPDAMFQFLKRFPETVQVSLEQNYRCPSVVLEAANAVIQRNSKRLGKKLWSSKTASKKIHLHVAETEHDQAEFVRDEIQKLFSTGAKPQDVAILVRSNAQSLAIELVLKETSIPYHINGGKEFLDRKEVADLLCYLKIAAHPSDLMSLFRVINVPSRKIGIVTLEKIRSRFELEKQTGSEAAMANALMAIGEDHKGVQDFWNLWSVARSQLGNLDQSHADLDVHNPSGVKGSIVATSAAAWLKNAAVCMGLFDEQRISSANMRQAQARQDVIEKTIDWVGRCEKPVQDLKGLMDALHLEDGFAASSAQPVGKVQIMSIHASKGLEFPHVFLIGLEEGQLPHERSLEEDPLAEEERRLFYVALTRAKETLCLSRSLHRNRGRTAEQREPLGSRFLEEIPEDLLVYSQADPEAKEAKRMDAAQRLFDMFR